MKHFGEWQYAMPSTNERERERERVGIVARSNPTAPASASAFKKHTRKMPATRRDRNQGRHSDARFGLTRRPNAKLNQTRLRTATAQIKRRSAKRRRAGNCLHSALLAYAKNDKIAHESLMFLAPRRCRGAFPLFQPPWESSLSWHF